MQAPKPGAGWNKFKIIDRNNVEYLKGHPKYKQGYVTSAGGPDMAVKMARARKARIAAAGGAAPKPYGGGGPVGPRLPGGPDRPKTPPRVRPPVPPRPPRRRPPNPPVFDSQ